MNDLQGTTEVKVYFPYELYVDGESRGVFDVFEYIPGGKDEYALVGVGRTPVRGSLMPLSGHRPHEVVFTYDPDKGMFVIELWDNAVREWQREWQLPEVVNE